MAKNKKETAPAQEQPTTENITKTVTDKLTNRPVINLAALEPFVRKQVTQLSAQLSQAIGEFGMSGLKIGGILKEIEAILKPRGVFVPYLNSLPGFSTATAYRYINAYDIAQEKFPKAILDRVITCGLPMIGSKDAPYGKYTDVVKKLPMPENPTTEQADKWLSKVQEEYRKGSGKNKGKAKLPDATVLQKEAYTSVLKRYQKVPDNTKVYWMKQLLGYICFNLGWPELEVKSTKPPADWMEGKKVEESDAA